MFFLFFDLFKAIVFYSSCSIMLFMSNGPTGPARQLSPSELRARRDTAIRRTGLTVGGERIFRGPSGRLQTEREARAEQASVRGEPSGRVLVVDGEVVDASQEQIADVAAATREAGQPLRAERTAEGGFVFSAPQAQAFQEQESVRALNLGDPRVARAVRELADEGLSPQQIFDLAERNVPLDTVASGFARASVVGPSGERLEAVVDREGNVVQVLSSESLPERSPVVSPLERGRAFGLFDEGAVERQPFFFSRAADRLEDTGDPNPFTRLSRGFFGGGTRLVGGGAERLGSALLLGTPAGVFGPTASNLQARGVRLQEEVLGFSPLFTDTRATLSGVGPELRTFEPDPLLLGRLGGEFVASAPIAAPSASLQLARRGLRSPVVRVPARVAAQPLVDAGLAASTAWRGFVRLFDDPISGLPPRRVTVGRDPATGRPFASGDLPPTVDFGVVAPRRRVVERSFIDSRTGRRTDLGLTAQEIAELQALPGGEQQTLLVPPRQQAGRALVTESGEVVGFSRDPSFRADELAALQQRQADELAAAIAARRDFDRLIGAGSAVEQRGLFPVQVIDRGAARRLDSDVVLFGDTASFQRDLLDFDVSLRPDRVSPVPVRSLAPEPPSAPRTSLFFSDEPFVDVSCFVCPRRSTIDIPGVRGRRAQFAPTVQVPRVTRVPRVQNPLRVVDDLASGSTRPRPSVPRVRLPLRRGVGFGLAGRGLLGVANNLASGSVSALDSRARADIVSVLDVDSVQRLDSELLFDTDARVSSRGLTRSRTAQDSVLALTSDSALRQATRSVTVPRSPTRQRARTRPRPRVPVSAPSPSLSPADSALGDFRVVVGRPGNVVFEDLGVGGRELVERGRDLARTTAAATVTVTPTREGVGSVRSLFGSAFKKTGPGVFVEKRSKRIDSPGELRDITARGLAAVRRAGRVTGGGADAARSLVDLGVPLREVRRRARSGGGLLDDFF